MCYNVQFKKHFLRWMLLRFWGASLRCLFSGTLVKRQVLVRRPGGRPETLTFWQAPRPCWGCCSVNPRWGARPQTPVFWIQFSKLKSCGVEHCPPSTHCLDSTSWFYLVSSLETLWFTCCYRWVRQSPCPIGTCLERERWQAHKWHQHQVEYDWSPESANKRQW